jgi:hypothetical protein
MKTAHGFIVLICVLVSLSCKENKGLTFQNQIISQQLLNATESFHIPGVETYKINYKSDGLNI